MNVYFVDCYSKTVEVFHIFERLSSSIYVIGVDTFTATKFYEVFSSKQPCQYIKMFQSFGDGVSPRNVGEF
jgi:hypothetical protein